MDVDKENQQYQILGRKLSDSVSGVRTPLHAVNHQTGRQLSVGIQKQVQPQCKTEGNKRYSWAPEPSTLIKSDDLARHAPCHTPIRTSKHSDRLQKRIFLMKVAKAQSERSELPSPGESLMQGSTPTSRYKQCPPALKSASCPEVSSASKGPEFVTSPTSGIQQDLADLPDGTSCALDYVQSSQNKEAVSFQAWGVDRGDNSSKQLCAADTFSTGTNQTTSDALEAVNFILDTLLSAVERKTDQSLVETSAEKSCEDACLLTDPTSAVCLTSCRAEGECSTDKRHGTLNLPPLDLLSPYTAEYCRFLASFPRNDSSIHSQTPVTEVAQSVFLSESEHFDTSICAVDPPNKWNANGCSHEKFSDPKNMDSVTCLDSRSVSSEIHTELESVLASHASTECPSHKNSNLSEDVASSSPTECNISIDPSLLQDMQDVSVEKTDSFSGSLGVCVTNENVVFPLLASSSHGECLQEKVLVVKANKEKAPHAKIITAQTEQVQKSPETIHWPSGDTSPNFEAALICPSLELSVTELGGECPTSVARKKTSQFLPHSVPEQLKDNACDAAKNHSTMAVNVCNDFYDGQICFDKEEKRATDFIQDQREVNGPSMPAQAEGSSVLPRIDETTENADYPINVLVRAEKETAAKISFIDAAVSPFKTLKLEADTMTMSVSTAEVGLMMEMPDCVDHGMLATTEIQHQTTMTDNTGCFSVHTSMTPFKLLVKQGKRLTSEDVRKQHPRTLANQLETLAVCNARLEAELQLADRERTRLRATVKEIRAALAAKEEEKMEQEDKQLKQWKEKENELRETIRVLEQEGEQRQMHAEHLETKLVILTQAGANLSHLHETEVSQLQDKCRSLEVQVTELKAASQASGYEQQFRHAMQLMREREAEAEELRHLFTDLEEAVLRQEKVSEALEDVGKKIKLFAQDYIHLRTQQTQKLVVLQGRCKQQEETATKAQEERQQMLKDTQGWKQMVELNQGKMAELEKLYSVASSDLVMTTSQMVKLNSELLGARTALQELLLSKEALAQETFVLEDRLSALQYDNALMTETLARTQAELLKKTQMCEELRRIARNMRQKYEDKLENLALGIENLQRTLDNREVDIDNLEKDLYECRNIIVEQRYKIDGLEKDLQDSRRLTAAGGEEDNIEFLKESNAYLEAERSLYVSSLRDLEEKLRVASLEARRQQQVAADAEELAVQLEKEKLELVSAVKSLRQQLGKTSHALALADSEHSNMESFAVMAATDLLQRMQAMLNELKKKIGLQEKADTPRLSVQGVSQTSALSAPKATHHTHRSFVSTILGTVLQLDPLAPGSSSGRGSEDPGVRPLESKEQNRDARVSTTSGTDVSAVMNASGDAASTGAGGFSCSDASNPDETDDEGLEAVAGIQHWNPSFQGLGLTAGDLAIVGTSPAKASRTVVHEQFDDMPLRIGENQNHLVVVNGTGYRHAPFQSSAFTPIRSSTTCFLAPSAHGASLVPPSSAPLSSAFARIRPLPRAGTQPSSERKSVQEDSRSTVERKQTSIVGYISMMEEVFTEIIHLGSIMERASQLSLRDLKAENGMLWERTEILEKEVRLSHGRLEASRQEAAAMEASIQQLKDRMQKMTDHIMSLIDTKFEVKRLTTEVKHLQKVADSERREKEVLSVELENLLKRLEASSSPDDAGTMQAKCVKDMIALKNKNQQLLAQLAEQQDHHEELGGKAARRIQVLQDNWRKAEDEVYRFDELVENIQQIVKASVESGCSYPELHSILRLLEGDGKL